MAKQSKIKPSQLTRVGYTYQDFMCLQILTNWFHDPSKYQWMSIEGNKELGNVNSLDDVICFTENGEYELYQVKFTTDSNRDDLRLDFEWLLERKPKGTSLIQKWSKDIEIFGKSNLISIAQLITNRKPDDVLSKCLDGNKINYNLIPEEIKKRIIDQLGEDKKALSFFENLIFAHSQQEIDSLELRLHDSLVPDHTTKEGWFQLMKVIERWATRKDEPTQDGKIYLEHLHEVLSVASNKTISQFFEIPGGYVPPVDEFHKQLLDKTAKPGCWVISGLPGMGKSTYLSFLTDQLIEKKTPVIRHHYYLSPHFIGDRIAFNSAAQSLQSQIKMLYPSDFESGKLDPEKLEVWISHAADKAAESNQTLVVIIDGLDHVYRERSDISQLQHLVNRLEPFKDRVCLIFGTQPISDAYLPSSLLRSAPRAKSWIEIPPMGLDAIKSRIDFLVFNSEINVIGEEAHRRNEIVQISQAILNISHGYPLHIIYSLNSLRLSENGISKYEVERLPTCPDGDINAYYENLWIRLSEGAKEILLLIANADFSWPNESHLGYCFEDSLTFRNSFSEIQHLVEKRLSGVTPFHSSLFVYLRRKDEFLQSQERLNRKSQVWISRHAPEYWKWGWGWIIEANLGNTTPLLQGITKEWLIQSLCNGYPLEHIEHIICVAERIAFDQKMYPELLRLRILKTRLLNGPEFQVQDFSAFLDCSLNCSPDIFGLLWRADNLRIIADSDIVTIAKHFQSKNEKIVDACANEIYRRLRFYAHLDDSHHYQVVNKLVDGYLEVLTSYVNPDLDRIGEFLERLTDKSSSLSKFVKLLIKYNHRELLLDLSRFCLPDVIPSKVIDEIALAASTEGAALEEIIPNIQSSHSYIALLHLFLAGKNIQACEIKTFECPVEHEAASYTLFHQYFFSTLVSSLNNSRETEEPYLNTPTNLEDFLKNSWSVFYFSASKIAANIKAKEKIEISVLYKYFSILDQPDEFRFDYHLKTVLFNIRKSLAKITIHLNFLCNSIDSFKSLDEADFNIMSENVWWDSRLFFDLAARNSILNIPKEIVNREFQKLYRSELDCRADTAALANESLDLSILASKYGAIAIAAKFLERTALNVVGYGHRKDITLHEVFEAIEECSISGCSEVSDWLRRMATFTIDVFDFSEREIRHIPGWFTKLLSKHNPERLVDEYDYHLSEENWHRTNIILESAVKSFSLSTRAEHSLLRCMTTYDALSALKERAKENIELEHLFDEQCNTLGGMPPKPRDHHTTEEEEITEYPDSATLLPNNLNEFKSTLHSISYRIREKFIADWILYWVDQDQGATILKSFNEYYSSGQSDYELNRCLHEIFLLSKKLEGKTKAYNWAVKDVKLNNLWSRFSHSSAEKSLKLYGSIYKNKWENLLRDTISSGSSRPREDETIIVPSSQLVVYLISADQIDLAVKITEVMVSSLEGDIAHLPLTKQYWYDQPVSLDEVPLHLIFIHYKWPDRYARLLTAKQIAALLEDDTISRCRFLYLEYLSKQQYETDIVDYLSILKLLDTLPFENEEIIQNIHFPSLISNQILLDLDCTEEQRELTALHSNFPDDLIPNRARYDRYANGLALRYMMVIEDLEEEYKAPFVNHFLLEWDAVQDRRSCNIFNPYDFCNDQFYRQDKIACSFSWAAESSILSAYVRTLAYAVTQHLVPIEVGLMHAQKILPFYATCIHLSPSNPPANWPKLNDLIKDQQLPEQVELNEYLALIASAEEMPLYANGPILRNPAGVCIDLKVILISLEGTEVGNPEVIFNFIDHGTNSKESIFPLAKRTWPSSFGRWEIDWLSRGYFRPTFSVGDFPIRSVDQNEFGVEYFCGNVSNGIWRYWIDQWYPVHHAGVGNSFGTCIAVSKDFFVHVKEQCVGNYYLIGEMSSIDKRDFNRNEKPIKTFAIHPV